MAHVQYLEKTKIDLKSNLLPWSFSTSMWAPDISRIALILQPPLPMTLLMAFAGTMTFFDFLTTSFHPASSRFKALAVFPVVPWLPVKPEVLDLFLVVVLLLLFGLVVLLFCSEDLKIEKKNCIIKLQFRHELPTKQHCQVGQYRFQKFSLPSSWLSK